MSQMRRKMPNQASKTVFQRTAMKTNISNVVLHPVRGGYRG